MSIYYDLLQEQINLLKEKGYEEKAIGSPDKEGWLFTQLRQSFSDALHQSWQEGESVAFQISTTGFFNSDKDIVHFKLNYEFNPGNSTLSMTQLELASDGIHRKINILNAADIPHSSKTLDLIRQHVLLRRKQKNRHLPVQPIQQSKRAR